MAPWCNCNCTILSETLVRVRLLSESIRINPVPTLISAREFLSAQMLSEFVSGRFTCPATQSSVPCGCTETDPFIYWRRAARVGGSGCCGWLSPDCGYCGGEVASADCRS